MARLKNLLEELKKRNENGETIIKESHYEKTRRNTEAARKIK